MAQESHNLQIVNAPGKAPEVKQHSSLITTSNSHVELSSVNFKEPSAHKSHAADALTEKLVKNHLHQEVKNLVHKVSSGKVSVLDVRLGKLKHELSPKDGTKVINALKHLEKVSKTLKALDKAEKSGKKDAHHAEHHAKALHEKQTLEQSAVRKLSRALARAHQVHHETIQARANAMALSSARLAAIAAGRNNPRGNNNSKMSKGATAKSTTAATTGRPGKNNVTVANEDASQDNSSEIHAAPLENHAEDLVATSAKKGNILFLNQSGNGASQTNVTVSSQETDVSPEVAEMIAFENATCRDGRKFADQYFNVEASQQVRADRILGGVGSIANVWVTNVIDEYERTQAA